MRQLLEQWWQQLRIAWKHLYALWQRGLPPVLRLREALERRQSRQVPHRRPPVRLACEVLEDINAPGNLLSAASASGVEAPPNGNVPPALSASPPPIQVIDATPAAEEAPAPPPVTCATDGNACYFEGGNR